MASISPVQVTIALEGSDSVVTVDFRNLGSDLDPEELEALTQQFFQQMKEIDEVKQVSRLPQVTPPEGSKPLDAAFIIGLLQAEVNLANIRALLAFIWERLSGKPIELRVEAEGKTLEVKAYSQQELSAAIEAAKDFLAAS